MRGLRIVGWVLATWLFLGMGGAPAIPADRTGKVEVDLSKQKLAPIASLVEEAIRLGQCPGAVVLWDRTGKSFTAALSGIAPWFHKSCP